MSDAFAPIVRARPNPIFGRPVHQGSTLKALVVSVCDFWPVPGEDMCSGFRHMSDVQELSISFWRIAAKTLARSEWALSKGAYSVPGLGRMMTLRQVEVIR